MGARPTPEPGGLLDEVRQAEVWAGEPDHRGAWGEVSDAIAADDAETITFRMSGLAWQVAMDAGWPEECPSGADAMRASPVRRQAAARRTPSP